MTPSSAARATADIGRLVTISTRIARHGEVMAIAERFPDVFCSVGTHPHYAHEELDIGLGDLVARTRHAKVVALGEAGLDYHYDTSPREAQEQGFRRHIAAARETGLPLVIHSRDADDDMARILEEETGRGPFPAVLHCFTGGRDLARRAIALGLHISFTGILTFKNSDELRAIAAGLPADRILVETDAPYLAPGPLPRQAQRAGLRGRDRQGAGRDPRRFARRDRAADDGEFLPFVRQSSAPGSRCRMTLKFTILGCGSSGGVPRPALGWGACDPNNPKNRRRRTSLLVERRNAAGVTRVLVDTSPDLREQLLDADVDWLDAVLYTHEHADHTHGIDDLRSVFIKGRRQVDVYLDEHTSQTMRARFGYCFQAPPGSEYPPIVREHRLAAGQRDHGRGAGRPDHRPADPAGAWRHRLVRLPLRPAGLFVRPQRHAAGERRGLGRSRRVDRRLPALPAASEPFLAHGRAELDRAAAPAPRRADQPARRPRLRGAAGQIAGRMWSRRSMAWRSKFRTNWRADLL